MDDHLEELMKNILVVNEIGFRELEQGIHTFVVVTGSGIARTSHALFCLRHGRLSKNLSIETIIYYKNYIIFCMRTLIDFAIRTEYARFKSLRDDLCEIGSQIDWERFRFLEPLLYKNKTSLGGRPNIDIVIMIKMLVLQHWFSLSDPELEWQVADRISFRIFLDTTEVVPDFSTVWLFRERLIKSGRFEDLWRELQRQIDEKGFIVKEGSIQDATFITSDPGQKKKKKDQESECKKEDQDLEAIG